MLYFLVILLACDSVSEPSSQVEEVSTLACQRYIDCGAIEDTGMAWCEEAVADRLNWTLETCAAGIDLDVCEGSIESWSCDDLLGGEWPEPFDCLSEGDHEG